MESAASNAPRALRRATIGDRLERARRRRFVGRRCELDIFTTALQALTAPFAVLYMHGPGGVGKTALLRRYAEAARANGLRPVWLDTRHCEPSRSGLMDGLCVALDLPNGASPLEALSAGGLSVLLIDTYETVAVADDWVREELLPALPANVLVVIAGRRPPGDGWRSDAAWNELLRVVALGNLTTDDCRTYLTASGVPPERHEEVIRYSHGHPLALSMLAEIIELQGVRATTALTDDPDLVRALLDRFAADIPDATHREALDACAFVRTMTESLLRDVLRVEDAGELFRWLRGLPFVDDGQFGLAMHDLARNLLDTDLRWRDPARHQRLLRRLLRITATSISASTGARQERLFLDLLYLHRTSPALAASFSWETVGSVRVEPLRPEDRCPLITMTRRHEGETSVKWAEFWLDRQPEAFTAFRGDGKLLGYCCYLRLHDADPGDRDADPATRAAWNYAQRHGPPRETEHVTLIRFVMDAEVYQHRSAAFNLRAAVLGRNWFGTPRLSWDFIAVREPYPLFDEFAYIDYHRAPEVDFEVDGQKFIVFAHDWRRRPLAAWGVVMEERGMIREIVSPEEAGHSTELVMSQPDFDEAVRSALRNVARPAMLAGNPLLRSQLVRRAKVGAGTPSALAAILRDAVEELHADPRDEKLYRVLERTFLRPAETQELAAEALDLPFSTYRRHLTQGVAAVTSRLWHNELYGEDATAS